jgi:DNA-binding NtrC family response regulator
MLRIQLIDQDAAARRRASDYLRAAGLEVHDAADADGALAQMRQATPDVVLLDPAMPRSQALMARCAYDARLRAVPVVLLSRQVNLSQAVLSFGARAGLAKPIDMDVLLAVLNRVAERASAVRRPRISPVASGCSGYPPVGRKSRQLDPSAVRPTPASVS